MSDQSVVLTDSESNKTSTLPIVRGTLGDPALDIGKLNKDTGFFTYDLKNLKRATIVGETTGGGAHPVSGHRIDDHYAIGVPFARAINPYSKTNWEGTGVAADVKVPAADALSTALRLISERRVVP